MLDPELPDAPPRVRTRRTDQPPGRSLNFQEDIAAETLMHIAGEDGENVKHKEILTNPITPEEMADPEAFEARRKELLAEAQYLVKVNASILKGKVATIKEYEQARAHQRRTQESLQKAIDLKAQWERQIKRTQEEEKKKMTRRRDSIPPRNINFDGATPVATPKDNMQKTAELLANDDDKIDLEYLRTIVGTAMKQQSKADSSRRLASNPEACVSAAQNQPARKQQGHRDDKSHTGSTERRRKTKEHPNPIPICSDTPKDKAKGKDPMFSGKDKYRNASPPKHRYAPPRPRPRSLAENVRPHGPGGINIRDKVEPRRSRNNDREAEGRHSRCEGGSRQDGGGSHHSQSQHHREGRGQSDGRSKRHHRPPHGSPSPPPSKGGGGGGRKSRSRSHTPDVHKAKRTARDTCERLNEYQVGYTRPKCFGKRIREEKMPKGLSLKLPSNLKHYDGKERPDTWIDDYYNAVNFAGGNPNIACRMLQLYLVGPARVWLNDLPENSIFCWFDLKIAFKSHFNGTYKRAHTTSDLQACIQKKSETSREYISRWLETRNSCENIDDTTAMLAFIGGLQRGGLLRHKLMCEYNARSLNLNDMISIASIHSAVDDDAGGDLQATAITLHHQKKNNGNNKRKNPPDDQKSGGSNMVAMTF
ncbi:hypothetical protein QYE76_008583 [Lolium multiflorum]|uniref:Retrotransposon gag domain-containing protein n=1 Tax=Lolium multiflorum TaxID=4521 RepID=A0AAD8TRJ2_LOLMU|nr:hypothetical protein QYE76_008583 [Lolium multiflorum]